VLTLEHNGTYYLFVIGLLYKANLMVASIDLQILLRLRPYPMRGHRLLWFLNICMPGSMLTAMHCMKCTASSWFQMPNFRTCVLPLGLSCQE